MTETKLLVASVHIEGAVEFHDPDRIIRTVADIDEQGWQIRGVCALSAIDPRRERHQVLLHLERESEASRRERDTAGVQMRG